MKRLVISLVVAMFIFLLTGILQAQGWETVLSDDFESADWDLKWDRYVWKGGYLWGRVKYEPYDGMHCLWCADKNLPGYPELSAFNDNYANNMDAFITSDFFSLVNCTDAILTFALWYKTQPDFDRVSLMVNPGTGYELIASWSGESWGWQTHEFSLESYIDKDNLKFAFRFESNGFKTEKGVLIDNIVLIRNLRGNPDLVCSSLGYNPAQVQPGGPLTVSSTVENITGFYSGDTKINYYLSIDTFILPDDIFFGYDDVRALGGGSSTFGQKICIIPSGTPAGYYYVGAIVDPDNLVVEKDENNNTAYNTNPLAVGQSGIVDLDFDLMPDEFKLYQNYPNPFNPVTNISYQISKSVQVTLKVYNPIGQRVATLVNGQQVAGYYLVSWQADDVPNGVYFYKLQAGEFTEIKKMTFIK